MKDDEITGMDGQDEATDDRAPFVIDSESRAEWLLRKLSAIDAEQARIKTQAAQRVAELQADADRLKFQFEQQLEVWAKNEATARRRKTVTLAYGTITFRTVPARFAIYDGQAAFDYAQKHLQSAIVETTTTTLDKAAYTRAAEELGEMLPGIEHQPAREAFGIKFPIGKDTPEETFR